jgi:outer membrane protein assembly factor BamB
VCFGYLYPGVEHHLKTVKRENALHMYGVLTRGSEYDEEKNILLAYFGSLYGMEGFAMSLNSIGKTMSYRLLIVFLLIVGLSAIPVAAEESYGDSYLNGFVNNISATQIISNPVVTVGDAVNISIGFRTPNEALTGAFTINATPPGWVISPVWIVGNTDPDVDDDPSTGRYFLNRTGSIPDQSVSLSGIWSQPTVSVAWTGTTSKTRLYTFNYFLMVPGGTAPGNYTVMAFAKSSPPAGGTQVAAVPGDMTITVVGKKPDLVGEIINVPTFVIKDADHSLHLNATFGIHNTGDTNVTAPFMIQGKLFGGTATWSINDVIPVNGTMILKMHLNFIPGVTETSLLLVFSKGLNKTYEITTGGDIGVGAHEIGMGIDVNNNIDELNKTNNYVNASVYVLPFGSSGGGSNASIILPNTSVTQNLFTSIPIRVANMTRGTGLSFNITYDPEILRMNNVTLNQSFASAGSSLAVNSTAGLIRVALASTELITIGSPTTMFFLNVTGIGAQGSSTALNFQDAMWSNQTFDIRQLETVNGAVWINGSSAESMFRGNPQHTGVFDNGGIEPTNQEKWHFQGGFTYDSSPAVSDGVVYIGGTDDGGMNGHLYAIDTTTAAEKWRFPMGRAVETSPAVFNGMVYVGGDYGKFSAIDVSSGVEKWHVNNGTGSSPTIYNGIVYFGSYDHNLYALYANTGTEKWHFTTGNDILRSSPAVADGIVFIGSLDHNLYAVFADNGTEKWRFTTGNEIYSSPSVANGIVYFGSTDHNLYAVYANNGTEKWHFTTGWLIASSPAIADDVVYIGSYDYNLYAVHANNGTKKWQFATQYWVKSSPAVANGVVYFGSFDHNLYAVDANNGTKKWQFTTTDRVGSSPVVSNGTVYFGGLDYNLYALGGVIHPIAKFSANITSGYAPFTAMFNDESTGSPTTWNWNFGDGSSVNATLQHPVHTFTTAGTFTVSLNVTNAGGSNTTTRTNYITVTSVKPFPKPGGGFFPEPTDPNHDGKYEDIDGNGWIGFNDVVVLYQNMEAADAGVYGPIAYYDYDNSGFIGFNDVVKLYGMT